ncbi:hypothetical protein [Mycolicibacterium celeriflavum]|uniref:Uncharacterized protein n=1 Tax=Mycolicibacterium celeriflavum TaxID=1249101 RepID=A0A7I7RFA9_MYCCF|nr:hypothetical protein [Mycolicibacterium celeriflavum]MCV7239562.1 hypothetical protein [Mycolicibacterium celeriflavum]BBY43254.1 hypothetical protein MCEL_15490 [Mycolicibacterium celeriflavum]
MEVLTEESYEFADQVAEVVAAAPPMTPDQRDRIASILNAARAADGTDSSGWGLVG